MRLRQHIGVIGSAIHAPRDPKAHSVEEAMYAVTCDALRDAGLGIDAIDGIVVAANDQLDGRAISVMMASGSVGGVGRDILSTPSAAEHAFVLGALRIASGQFRTQLVVAWSPTEVDSIPEALKLGTDPYFHRALPLDEFSASAMQAVALESTVAGLRELAINVVSKNRKHGVVARPHITTGASDAPQIAGGKMKCWPLTETMVSAPAFGLVAVVLADQDFIEEKAVASPAWIQGMGWATEAGFLGDRDLTGLLSLNHAARQAYDAAGVASPTDAFDLAELSDATPYQELIAYEALGLCSRTLWAQMAHNGRFARGGALPVNLSGGALCFNPIYCAGLVSIAEAANQVRGCAGHHQVKGAERALAHAASGFAMQYNTVVVLGNKPTEVHA